MNAGHLSDRWYRKNLGDALFASPEIERIKHLCLESDDKSKMSVYYRHESGGQLHCDFILYFPPECRNFALSIDAVSCEQPDRHDLALLF
ncbi:hypothetical protein [Vibrio rumoiensis]|uniref:Uncharacterized protein n=1 Tax=Vibrio rumoiensis 1S-45 TaxID=1188252 RepID=A0A1E5E066_9VIBR|nr:hypothetical protein [Vibrio rumoiensis]OEF23280.1 hypothetical protein A1QC_12315 [Vibrio rumoiensis 1S-45]